MEAERPDRAPARPARARQAVRAPRVAVLRVSPAPGARAVPLLPLTPPRASPGGPRIKRAFAVPAVPVAPGGSCDIAAGGCSLHPCVTYAGSSTQTAVLRAPGVIAPAPGPAAAPRRPCVASAPAQRLVTARLAGAG